MMINQLQRFVISTLLAATALSSHLRAQADVSPPPPVREGSLPVAVLIVEAAAFGAGLAARSESGARVVGAIDGVSGLAVMGIAAWSNRQGNRPELLVPYGIGLLGLSYYNFASASSGKREPRFWTNAIGFNAAVIAGVLSGMIWRQEHPSCAVSVRAGPSGVLVNIPF